jgi:hypothetical protein
MAGAAFIPNEFPAPGPPIVGAAFIPIELPAPGPPIVGMSSIGALKLSTDLRYPGLPNPLEAYAWGLIDTGITYFAEIVGILYSVGLASTLAKGSAAGALDLEELPSTLAKGSATGAT